MNRLVRHQGGRGQSGVGVVAGADNDGVDARIRHELGGIGGQELGAIQRLEPREPRGAAIGDRMEPCIQGGQVWQQVGLDE